MDADRWLALCPLLDHALELASDERAAWLETMRRDEPVLAGEIEQMLNDAVALEHAEYLEAGPPALRQMHPTSEECNESAGERTFGPYTLERLLGRGGMGAVWLAHRSDGRYEAKVAVKLLNAALIGKAAERRFRREGQLLARLSHPHITRLLDAGVGAGAQPYLVLEVVDGERIDAYCDARRLTVDARLRLFLDVLAAVEHAHAHLIVHRDIKPENILVADDGNVKLLDFGIAKLVEDETGTAATQLTRDGGRLLTPEYAAPEQLTGRPVTVATDVHALGALLYRLLTGRLPTGDTTSAPADLVKAIVAVPPPRLSTVVTPMRSTPTREARAVAACRASTPERLRQRLRGDLDSIVAKALQKEPAARYASVAAFADDIRRHLAAMPVRARPDSLRYRAFRFVRRNRMAVALSALAIAATLAGVAGTLMQAQRVAAQRDFALRQLARAATFGDFSAFLLYGAAPAGKAFTASELLRRAEHIVVRAAPDEMHVDMLAAIGNQYLGMDDDADGLRLLRQAYDESRDVSDVSQRARAACGLAKALARRVGSRDAANRKIDEALALLPDQPQFRIDRIGCLLDASEAARDIGDMNGAVERAEAARDLAPKLAYPSKALALRTAIALAESYRVAGEFAKSNRAFQSAYTTLQALGRDQTQQAGTLLNDWGVALDQMGQPLRAEALLRRAIDISREDASMAGVSPMLLNNYARVLSDLDRLDEASRYIDHAYAEAQRADNEIVMNMATTLRADVLRKRGDFDGAALALDDVLPRLHETLPPDHYFFALTTSERSLLAAERHDESAALALANQAVDEAQNHAGNPLIVPIVLLRRARLEIDLGQVEHAEADATKAVALVGQVVGPDGPSSALGRAYLTLASAQVANGKPDEAKRSFATAAAQLRETLGSDNADTKFAVAAAH